MPKWIPDFMGMTRHKITLLVEFIILIWVKAAHRRELYNSRMLHRLILVFVLMLTVGIAQAQLVDPHAVYEQKCGRCHEDHARAFADQHLVVKDDRVIGKRRSRDLENFLINGHGKLEPAEVRPLVAHLKSVVDADGLYEKKCRICHEPAVDFARIKLIMVEDKLMGRYSKQNIDDFMIEHGRVSETEHAIIMDALKRQIAK